MVWQYVDVTGQLDNTPWLSMTIVTAESVPKIHVNQHLTNLAAQYSVYPSVFYHFLKKGNEFIFSAGQ